jgi:hypothetical protein
VTVAKIRAAQNAPDQRGKHKTRVHYALQLTSSKAQLRPSRSEESILYLSSGVIDSTGAGARGGRCQGGDYASKDFGNRRLYDLFFLGPRERADDYRTSIKW